MLVWRQFSSVRRSSSVMPCIRTGPLRARGGRPSSNEATNSRDAPFPGSNLRRPPTLFSGVPSSQNKPSRSRAFHAPSRSRVRHTHAPCQQCVCRRRPQRVQSRLLLTRPLDRAIDAIEGRGDGTLLLEGWERNAVDGDILWPHGRYACPVAAFSRWRAKRGAITWWYTNDSVSSGSGVSTANPVEAMRVLGALWTRANPRRFGLTVLTRMSPARTRLRALLGASRARIIRGAASTPGEVTEVRSRYWIASSFPVGTHDSRLMATTSPSRPMSQHAGTVPTPGTSTHSECRPSMPRVSSSWSRASRRRSVAVMTSSVRSILSSMESRTVAMARCSARGGRSRREYALPSVVWVFRLGLTALLALRPCIASGWSAPSQARTRTLVEQTPVGCNCWFDERTVQ